MRRARADQPRVSEFALALAHDEVLRLRERQAARIASIRGRCTAVLSASGVAASLVTVLSDNPWYALAIAFFALATIYSVLAMAIRATEVVHPKGVLASLIDQSDYSARLQIINQIRKEYDRAEHGLQTIARHTRTATGWFCCGTVALLMVSALLPIASMSGRG